MRHFSQTVAIDDRPFTAPSLETGNIPPERLLTPRDRELLADFDTFKCLVSELNDNLHDTRTNLLNFSSVPNDLTGKLERMLQLNNQLSTELAPKFLDYCVNAMHDAHDRKVSLERLFHELTEAKAKLHKIQSHPAYRIGANLLHTFRTTRDRFAKKLKQKKEPKVETPMATPAAEIFEFKVENPFASVDNRGTPFELFRNWVSVFEKDGVRFGSQVPLVSDQIPSIYQINQRYEFKGKRILELGSLEGANTKQLLDLGAAHVTAIEFNPEFFMKCLLVKYALGLDGADFYFGDLNQVLRRPALRDQRFDFIFCSGLLYHMEHPIQTIELIIQFAPAIYVWSQVASEHGPSGEWVTLTDSAGTIYRGKRNVYRATDTLGGVGGSAVWLTPESMRSAFESRGFSIDEWEISNNGKGAVVTFTARHEKGFGGAAK